MRRTKSEGSKENQVTESRVLLARSRNAGKEPIVVPVVVVAIAIHVALVVPTVERQVAMCGTPSVPPPFEYSRG